MDERIRSTVMIFGTSRIVFRLDSDPFTKQGGGSSEQGGTLYSFKRTGVADISSPNINDIF